MKLKVVVLLSLGALGQAGSPEYFFPSHRISGVGVERDALTPETLQLRTDLMVQAQTFIIMREADAFSGARRVTSPRLQSIIRRAPARRGLRRWYRIRHGSYAMR